MRVDHADHYFRFVRCAYSGAPFLRYMRCGTYYMVEGARYGGSRTFSSRRVRRCT